uniref:DNA-directed RNA polymerase n=1 Tax=viral metagenome TaxID=1070528 RepID=A0A6C0FBX4_9ZZZZ|tara:strand:+ start:38703 stop:43217 length:4515 start_codon:yes stop_codon:yes gene_type:complete
MSSISNDTNVASSKIIGVQFSMLSPEEIRRNSVVEISSRDTYINNKPVVGGLFDPRMGVLEPGLICPTDGYTYIDTPGYFGHIELARPVFYVQHIKEIMKISKMVCYKCSKLLINKNQHTHILNYPPEKRWQYISNLRGNITRCGECTDDGCGCLQPSKIRLEGFATIKATIEYVSDTDGEKSSVEIKLTPEFLLRQFKRISDDDVHFMGFSPIYSRPEWMVCQVLAVPPPSVRPSVKHDAQQRSEDDLTHIYSSIIKNNTDLAEKIANNASPNVIEQLVDTLQYLIAMIVNNKIKGAEPMAQRSGRTMNCIMSRLNSKTGRIRGNLMGKRVDFSARSVITGDPNLSIRQLGVPLKIAMNITKPIKVNERNRDFLMKLIQNGPDEYPGAKILEKKNGENITLRYVDRNSVRLMDGDIVHRHMMDGDAVLFNRQPSLHRMSMMCHIVKIMKKGDTFRMNVGDTKPYNADFDGDEMNMHMPQNVLAETELKHLAAIPYQMISPAGNSPIIGIYQDSLLGSYRFTRPELKFTPRDAMNILMMFKHVDPTKLNIVNGKIANYDILSQILPPMTLVGKTNLFKDDEDYQTSSNILEIRDGKYIRGQLEKKVIGSTTKGILHRICNDFGNMQSSNFVDDLQNIITEYMKSSSFSVGISDLIADKKTQDNIIHAITTQKQEVQSIIEKVHLGTFENNTSNTNNTEFELNINNVLNKATEQAGKIGRNSLSKNNRFLMIVNCGSKGSLINISQMISCLGQTNVDGKRIPYGFDNRTLPHFSKFDDSPSARGFIENSYISGLTAPELFFHAMGGRIGLIDTAVKTSQTGYIQRRLIKGLEDIKVEYDMTIRNNMGKIIQFKYGDDNFDSTKTENQFIPLVGMSVEDIYAHYDILGTTEIVNLFTKGTATRFRKQKKDMSAKCKVYIDNMLEARNKIVENVFNYSNDNGIRMPVAFQNIIVNIQGQLNLNVNSLVDITPLEAFDLIEEYLNKLKRSNFIQPNKLFEIMYLFYLNPRDLITKKRFHRKGLTVLLETIILRYKQAVVHPGETVGVIAGQSIGEPTTQLTLNTFHLSGVASKSNVTRGVPRIEEILRLTKNPKNPSLTVHLKSMDETSQDKASHYANILEHTKLVELIKKVQICFDPEDQETTIEDDQLLMQQYYEFEKIMDDCIGEEIDNTVIKSKWIIRMEFNQEILLEKNITMDDIHFAINNSHGNEISCVYNDYNSNNLVFRIRMNSSVLNKSKKQKNIQETLDQSDEIYLLRNFQDSLLNNIVLRGIPGITNVLPRKLQNMVVKEDDRYLQKDVYVLDTTGSNLMDVLAFDFIDNKRTYSNDIKEVFNVLGIEAARQILYNEFVEVMDFSDVYINYHHLSVLCDRMTANHNMVAIFRSGILNDNVGPISKSTFEVHTEVLLDASRHASLDYMRGVSASVMMGQTGNYGTGMFQVVLDTDAMKDIDDIEVSKNKGEEEINRMFTGLEDQNDSCSKNNITISNSLSNMKQMDVGQIDDDYDLGI